MNMKLLFLVLHNNSNCTVVRRHIWKLSVTAEIFTFSCTQACSVCMCSYSVCLDAFMRARRLLCDVLILFLCLRSSFCWKRPGSASSTATPGPSKKPGGSMWLARSMSRWGKKVSDVTSTFVGPSACVSISHSLYLGLCSLWPAVEPEGEAASQPQQKLCRRLPGYGWQAGASAVSGQERKDRLRRQSHKIWPSVQGWFSSAWICFFPSTQDKTFMEPLCVLLLCLGH